MLTMQHSVNAGATPIINLQSKIARWSIVLLDIARRADHNLLSNH